MKKITLAGLLALLIAGCGEFPTRYDRIETDKVRSIGFEFGPQAEGAPGDTMHVRAFFGGEPVASVNWQFSYDRILSLSSDAIINIRPLAAFNVSDRLPDSMDISFVIPDSTFYLTKAIPPEVLNYLRPELPAGMRSMSQADFASFLADLGSIDLNNMATLVGFAGRWGPAMGISAITPSSIDSVMSIAGALVMTFSIHGELFATAISTLGHTLKIKGEFTIRYNSRFKNDTAIAAMLPVNRNPAVRWIGVYKVKDTGGRQDVFGGVPALTDADSLTFLYNEFMPWKTRDTVLIEKGYSYYLAADSGSVSFHVKAGDSIVNNGSLQVFSADTTFIGDTIIDKRYIRFDSAARKPVYDYETYNYDWEYENLALAGVTMPQDSLFVIAGGGEGGRQPPVVQFLPSIDRHMTRARIWVTVSDDLYGDKNRPVGQTIRTVDLFFKYAN